MAARFAETCELHGADVDAEAIAWACVRFAALYCFSVVSQMPEALHRAWLEEFHRITRPGVAVVITVQGRRMVERFVRGDKPPAIDIPSREQMRAGLPELEARGFVDYPIPHAYAALPEADRGGTVYGMTFHYETYIRARWLDLFELVELRPAPTDWQDYVILRRR